MRRGRALLPLLLLASACVDITINNPYGATDAGAGTASGGSPGGGVAPGSDSGTVRPPKATDRITLRGNLDQTATVLNWDGITPKTTSNFVTSLTVYDSLGMAVQVDIYFSKNDRATTQPGDSGDWTYHVMTDGRNLDFQADGTTRGWPGSITEIATGSLRFDTSGRLISNVTTSQGFYPKDALSPQVLIFNFGTGTEDGGSGLDGLTQYAATSAVSIVDQSGWASSY